MSRRLHLVYIAAFFLAWRFAAAADFDIYVFNHHYSGKTVSRNGVLYVDARKFAEALGLPVVVNGKLLAIGSPAPAGATGAATLNGKPLAGIVTGAGGTVYVPFRELVKETGNKAIVNSQTGIIDVVQGNSQLTQSLAESLSKTEFPVSGVSYGTMTLGFPPQAAYLSQGPETSSLDQNFVAYAETRGNAIYYFARLADWGASLTAGAMEMEMSVASDLQALQSSVKQGDEDRLRAVVRQQAQSIREMSQSLAGMMGTIDEVVPPPAFAASYAALKQAVGDGVQFASTSSELISSAYQNPASGEKIQDNPEFQQLKALAAKVEQDKAAYGGALNSDLRGLPRVSAFPGVQPEVLGYFSRLEIWEDRLLFANNSYMSSFQNSPDPRAVSSGIDSEAAILQAAQQTFMQIAPPPEFRNSHAALMKMIALYPGQVAELAKLKALMGPARPSSLMDLLTRTDEIIKETNTLQRESEKAAADYLAALKSDLSNLH